MIPAQTDLVATLGVSAAGERARRNADALGLVADALALQDAARLLLLQLETAEGQSSIKGSRQDRTRDLGYLVYCLAEAPTIVVPG